MHTAEITKYKILKNFKTFLTPVYLTTYKLRETTKSRGEKRVLKHLRA